MKNAQLVSAVCERLAGVVGEHAKRGELPVTVGGDHSLVSRGCIIGSGEQESLLYDGCGQALGSITGTMSKHPDACVLWVRRFSSLPLLPFVVWRD
jgi:arginase